MQSKEIFGNQLRQLRQARGMSQQKLSEEVGVSYRHINFLENSRARPSRETVSNAARALNLSLKYTNALLRSAGFSALHPVTSLDDETMKFAKAAVSRILEQQNPYPGVAMTPIGNLVLANEAVFKLFGLIVPIDTLASTRNIYEFFLTDERIKKVLVNWEQLAPRLLELVRQELFEIDALDETRALLDKLEKATGLKGGKQGVVGHSDLPLFTLQFELDEISLSFFSTYTTFGTPHDVALQELRIECFYPADEFTEEFCQNL